MTNLPLPYSYEHKYIALNVPMPADMPATVTVGQYTLLLKSEFHISLLKVSFAIEHIKSASSSTEEEIVTLFEDFIKRQPLDVYKPLMQFRFVQLDTRKTVVGLVEVPHIAEFFEELRTKYQTDIPVQATHITMYTLQPEAGIGILSQEQLERDSVPVDLPELADIQFIPVSR